MLDKDNSKTLESKEVCSFVRKIIDVVVRIKWRCDLYCSNQYIASNVLSISTNRV